MSFDVDERVAIYLEAFFCNLNLKSFNLGVIPDFDGSESEIEKMAKFNAAEAKSQKVGLRILTRKNNIGDWQERAEIILVNRGRKDYFDLLQPYLAKNQVRIFEKNDALAVQLIDYNNGLLKPTDSLGIETAFTITIAKKNSLEAFEARLSALETLLQPFGAATATASGTTGLVKGAGIGESEFLLRGDRQWQNPTAFVRMIGEQLVGGLKTFTDVLTSQKTIRSVGAGDLSTFSAQSQVALFSVGAGGYISLSSAAAPPTLKVVDFGMNPQGECSLRRINDTYTTVLSTLATFDASHNLKLFNFTNFGGNVYLKVSRVTGTTPSSQGTELVIPLSISSVKVVAAIFQINFDINGFVSPGFPDPGYQYLAYVDESCAIFRLHATNSANLLNKPCSCLIFYTN
jgi:hypothetical protein